MCALGNRKILKRDLEQDDYGNLTKTFERTSFRIVKLTTNFRVHLEAVMDGQAWSSIIVIYQYFGIISIIFVYILSIYRRSTEFDSYFPPKFKKVLLTNLLKVHVLVTDCKVQFDNNDL